jgi:hypothetical protein
MTLIIIRGPKSGTMEVKEQEYKLDRRCSNYLEVALTLFRLLKP